MLTEKKVIQYNISYMQASQINTYKSAALVHKTVLYGTDKQPMTIRLHYLIDESKGTQKRFYAPIPEDAIPQILGVTKKKIIDSYKNSIGTIIYLIDLTGLNLNFPITDPGNEKRVILKEAVRELIRYSENTELLPLDLKNKFLELAKYVEGIVNDQGCSL